MRTLLAVLTLLLVAGCGGGSDDAPEPDKAKVVKEWKAALASTGFVAPDWDRFEQAVKENLCDDDDYDLYVTLGRGPEALSLAQERINVKYGCPDNLDAWDAAIVKLGETTARVDYVCEAPFDSLSTYDQHEALLVCDQYQTPEWERYYEEHFPPEVEATLEP